MSGSSLVEAQVLSRGLFFFIIAMVAVAVFFYWGIPLLKQKFIGKSLQVRINVTWAFEDHEIEGPGGELVSRTIVGMEILFPMGGAPENTAELIVRGDDGRTIEVNWGTDIVREDMPDQSVTRWLIKDAYFPSGFRHGMLCNKVRDLYYFKLQPFPLNP